MAESSNVVVEKSLRSVFVGNIPYEATEEKLRDIFGQAGPVLSFKLMYDRETGKPKGYGFCEYKDQETALSAMRIINGYEIGGRPLRVDNACTEKSRMEMQSLMMGPVIESPYGPDVEPERAPEAISNAVASLPPEQMYELMRQMKLCVRNNPSEARTMLLKNPQLAYALLQAQVVMRIVDPKAAVQILHGARDDVEPLNHPKSAETPSSGPPKNQPPSSIASHSNAGPPTMNGGPPISHNAPMPNNFAPSGLPTSGGPMPGNFPPVGGPSSSGGPMPGHPMMPPHMGPPMRGPHPRQMPPLPVGAPHPVPPPMEPFSGGGDYDLRQMGTGNPRPPMMGPPGQGPPGDMDLRMGPPRGGPPPPMDFEGRYNKDFDQREHRFRDGPPGPHHERDPRENFSRDPRESRGRDPRSSRQGDRDRDREYRDRDKDRDFRNGPDGRGRGQDKDLRGPPPQSNPRSGPPSVPNPQPGNLPPGLAGQDQEKASLIMQVLQLSDEQIKMLPPEQQASIMQLKEQIQRSSV